LLHFTAVLKLLKRHIVIFHCSFETIIEAHCYILLQFWNYYRGTLLYFTAVWNYCRGALLHFTSVLELL